MKSNSSALTPGALAAAASRKTTKVQRDLRVAEEHLRDANAVLVEVEPKQLPEAIESVVENNVAAEERIHQAAEELEEVKVLLADAQARVRQTPPKQLPGEHAATPGNSGHGAKSLIPLLDGRTA